MIAAHWYAPGGQDFHASAGGGGPAEVVDGAVADGAAGGVGNAVEAVGLGGDGERDGAVLCERTVQEPARSPVASNPARRRRGEVCMYTTIYRPILGGAGPGRAGRVRRGRGPAGRWTWRLC